MPYRYALFALLTPALAACTNGRATLHPVSEQVGEATIFTAGFELEVPAHAARWQTFSVPAVTASALDGATVHAFVRPEGEGGWQPLPDTRDAALALEASAPGAGLQYQRVAYNPSALPLNVNNRIRRPVDPATGATHAWVTLQPGEATLNAQHLSVHRAPTTLRGELRVVVAHGPPEEPEMRRLAYTDLVRAYGLAHD